MFLIESITNRRSTEPLWFRSFRGFFAIALTGVMMYYLITQLVKIDVEASTIITFKSFQEFELKVTLEIEPSYEMIIINNENFIDTKNIEIVNHKSNNTQVSLRYNKKTNDHKFSIRTQKINNTDISSPTPTLSLSIESFQLFPNDLTFFLKTSPFPPLSLGQRYSMTFKPIMVIDEIDKEIDLNIRFRPFLGDPPIPSNESEFYIGSRLYSPIVRIETTKIYDLTDLVSKLGGFYGAIAGIFVLFFGMSKHEPWGLAQKYIFSCTPCRRSLKRKFARKYVSSAGIPLAEKVNQRPKKPKESKEPEESLEEKVQTLGTLEGRIQILETLLEDYYLDIFYLRKVKEVITNYENSKMYKQNENDKSINEKSELIDRKVESITVVEVPIDKPIMIED